MTARPGDPAGGRPAHLRPGAVRWSWASGSYEETVGFYRDVVGLPVIGGFTGSFGEDGTIVGLPDAGTQLEIIRARGDEPDRGSFDQLVLYLDDAEAVTAATAPLRARGVAPDPGLHPYWRANGAVGYRDPDGRGLVFAPWVYGRDPDPADRPPRSPAAEEEGLRIREHTGDRAGLRPLFELAEDSAVQLDGYLDLGRVLVAERGGTAVGHVQLVPAGDGQVEIKNMAVVPGRRGTGVGRALIEAAVERRGPGVTRVVVATGAADVGNLGFYQRCGFRFASIERDAFTPATGYPDPIDVDGIELRDRVWLTLDL